MGENSIKNMVDITLEKLRSVVSADTVVGTPIQAGGMTLIPVSKVTFGLASGGSDFPNKTGQAVFGGGSGAGVSVTPVAFLAVKGDGVRVLPIAVDNTVVDRAIAAVPELVELFKKPEKPDM